MLTLSHGVSQAGARPGACSWDQVDSGWTLNTVVAESRQLLAEFPGKNCAPFIMLRTWSWSQPVVDMDTDNRHVRV